MGRRKRILLVVCLVPAAGILIGLLANPGYYLGSAYSGEMCAQCHLISTSVDEWKGSPHRELTCQSCHGSALTLDHQAHATHWRRLYLQATGQLPVRVVLKDRHVDAIVQRCAECHQAEYAQWRAGGHSMTYGDVFLNADENRRTLLHDDCVRCHGMFYDGGGIHSLVEPIDNAGPWLMVDPAMTDRPAIPCLACHQMHRPGSPVVSPDYSNPRQIFYSRRKTVQSLAFYDQRDQMYVGLDRLPLPAMREGDRPVRMSPDPRQRLCYQCHAPTASLQVGSGDDRTGIGVHEGISCLACHSGHSQDARASCGTCHPKMSNCGLDVETMDTSFRSPSSRHNIHFVKCADCHPEGIPARRDRSS